MALRSALSSGAPAVDPAAIAAAVVADPDLAALVEAAVRGALNISTGTGTATGAGTTGSFPFSPLASGPGGSYSWAVYGWHIMVYGAASDVAIVCGGITYYLGRSMPVGATPAVSSTFPLYAFQDDAAITFLKTSGASVELTLYCAPIFVV
jgi:hypothetical protein